MLPDHAQHAAHVPSAPPDPAPGGEPMHMPMDDKPAPKSHMEHMQPTWPHFANMVSECG